MKIPLMDIIGMAYLQASNAYEDRHDLLYPIRGSFEDALHEKEKLRELYNLAAGKTGIEIYVVTCNGKISQEAYESLSKAQKFIIDRSDKPEKADEYVFIAGANKYEIHPVSIK